MEFKDIFHNLRVSRNLNQAEMAKILKLSRSTISMWESGERTPPFERIEEIADFFNVDIDYLMGRTQKTTIIPDRSVSSEDLNILVELHKLSESNYTKLKEYIKFLKSLQDNEDK